MNGNVIKTKRCRCGLHPSMNGWTIYGQASAYQFECSDCRVEGPILSNPRKAADSCNILMKRKKDRESTRTD